MGKWRYGLVRLVYDRLESYEEFLTSDPERTMDDAMVLLNGFGEGGWEVVGFQSSGPHYNCWTLRKPVEE